MRRWLITLACLVSTLGCNKSAAPVPVLVGHVATLSGNNKDAGEQASRGIRLAVQEQNAEAKEKEWRPLRVIHADAQGRLDAFQGEAVRLVTINKVAGL